MSDNIVKVSSLEHVLTVVSSENSVYQGYIQPEQIEGTAVVDNDPRLSDARTPTAHAASHGTGQSDAITIAESQVTNLTSDLSAKAPLSSPTLTGTPAAPTAAVGTNTTQVATTAFVNAEIANDAATKVDKSAVGNLLTANQASIETDTTGFVGFQNVASMSASSAAALYGSKSLAVTSTGSDDTKIQLSSGLYTYDVPATAGQTYTFSVYVKSAATPRSALAVIVWRDAGGSGISTTTGTAVTTTTSGWTRVLVTDVAPAGTVHAQPVITIVSSVANEVHYFDGFGFWEGAGGQWALPGTPITNLGFYTDESCGRRLFQWDGNNARWQMTYGDTGLRDLTASITGSVQTSNPNLELKVRRVNSRVEWKLSETAPGSGSGTLSLLTADAGFRPAGVTAEREAMSSDNTGKPISDSACEVNTTGEVYLYGVIATRLNATVAYETTNAWPTTLPGTASGSIPA